MDENISIKYAVYITKDGSDSLEVVRDTLSEAQGDMERLKNQASRIRVDKASIKNFKKDDEKVVHSETIYSWDSSDGKGNNNGTGSLSDHHKASGPDVQPSGSMNPDIQSGAVPPMPPLPPPVIVEEKKEYTWKDHYAKYGALFYVNGWDELTSAKKEDTTDFEGTGNENIIGNTGSIEPISSDKTIPPSNPVPEFNKGTDTQPLSDSDVDKIAEKLKEKLTGTNIVNPVKKEPEITISE